MYKHDDFAVGDVVFCTGNYKTMLIAIVTGTTPKMIRTTRGLKSPNQLCFASDDVQSKGDFQWEFNNFKSKVPNTNIKFKMTRT